MLILMSRGLALNIKNLEDIQLQSLRNLYSVQTLTTTTTKEEDKFPFPRFLFCLKVHHKPKPQILLEGNF